MTLKILQLNIWQGAFIDRIVDFVKKEDFDVLHFQEVTGGKLSRGGSNRYVHKKSFLPAQNPENIGIDSLKFLQKALSDYADFSVPTWKITGDKNSYHGIATFVKKEVSVKKMETIWMKEFTELPNQTAIPIEQFPRAAISLEIKIDSQTMYLINTHLAWSPDDRDNEIKITQSKMLYEYIQNLGKPVILTGDFNVSPDTKTASQFEEFGENLTRKNGITNTLNPRTHNAKQLFPKGLAVDFIFIPHAFEIKKFRLIDDIDLSDHFGLVVEVEI